MKNITAVFLKQIKETFRNKTILIQFLMFPVMVIIMENAIKLENMPEHFFVKLFAVMFVGMAPLTCMSAIISEEKEKNTLRALMMSNVKPFEYLLGVGAYVFIMCIIGAVVFAVCGGYEGKDLLVFMVIMGAGILLSSLTGAVIGVFSKNQMSATSITIPVMMIFSFLPMLSMFNESIEKVARITYSQQMSILINGIGNSAIKPESIIIIAVNFVVASILFTLAFRKKGLE
ncbi:MAG: ABC transporter permease [Oscillospiraceae bacterium]|nr:ABC transporter permease [Oscillospiraceae bacterium]